MTISPEQLRLEALQLAVNGAGFAEGFRSTGEIIERAKAFADFVIDRKLPEKGVDRG